MATAALKTDAPPPQGLTSPRHSLQLKAMLAVIGLVALTTGLCGYLTTRMAVLALDQSLERTVTSLTTTAGQSVAPYVQTHHTAALSRVLEDMALDSRIAFITVTNAKGQVIARRISNSQAWSSYLRHHPRAHTTAVALNRTVCVKINNRAPLLVRRQPIWPAEAAAATPAQRGYAGFIELALTDIAAQSTANSLRAATIGVVCLICLLCIPPVLWVVNRWVRPLRQMVDATIRLAAGDHPEPVSAPGNNEIAILGAAFNDMAGRLACARHDLQEANDKLEQRIADRTAALEQANRRLQQDMQDKDDFVRTVSHDLNAPLRNIAGMTRMLLTKHREQMTDEALTKLERIAANAKAETDLLADLLELNRIKSQPGKIQPVDLNELLASITESLAFDLQERRIALHIAEDMPTVHVNRNRIRQVFQNLLDNAVKYMADDQATPRIDVRYVEAQGQRTFIIADNGRGIAPEDRQRIFQVFQRARYSGADRIEGRGVGLASVKAIIEAHGGQLWVDSQIGKGSVFKFTLGDDCYADPEDSAANPAEQSLQTTIS
jgi:signal transduction histidine kinase